MRIHYTATVWGAGFYEFFTRALESLGHEVMFFSESGSGWLRFRYKAFSKIPKRAYEERSIFRRSLSKDWLESVKSFRPDLLIFDFAANITPAAVEEGKKVSRAPLFYWLTSPSWGNNADDMLLTLRMADKIFTIDRDWSSTVLFGFKNFIFLPLAGDPAIFKPLPNVKKDYDVAYLGGFPPQAPDGVLRAALLSSVPEKYRVAGFGHNAGYWISDFPNLKNKIQEGYLPTEKVNEVYNKTKIMLNIHSPFHFTSISARTFEIGLSGGFQIAEYREDLDRLFPAGLIPSFRNVPEMNALIDKWVPDDNDNSRDARAKEIREHILANHTWAHRAKEILSYL